MRKRVKPRANDSLVQRSIVRSLSRIDSLVMRLVPCEPFANYEEAIKAEKRTLAILDGSAPGPVSG